MNPIKRIGRYQLPILNVVAIQQRQFTRLGEFFHRLKLLRGGYDVTLSNGRTLHFTEEEKQAYDEEIQWHGLIMNFHGMCRGLGLRG